MKILIATDGSKGAEFACELLNHMPDIPDADVCMVYVTVPLPESPVPFPSVFTEDDLILHQRIEEEHETRAAERLEACRSALPTTWNVVAEARVGHPPTEVLEAISAHQPDLVVLGARGMDEAPLLNLGSVSQKVSRYAECPVLVVRETGTRLKRALVALDRGAGADAVLGCLNNAPWLKGCALTLTHVVEDRYLKESRVAASQFSGSGNYLDRLQASLLKEAREFLETAAEKLRTETGRTVDTLVLEGEPARTLIQRAGTGFDLLVLGARGRHGLGRFLLGSTSQKVLRHSPTSVLVIHTPA